VTLFPKLPELAKAVRQLEKQVREILERTKQSNG